MVKPVQRPQLTTPTNESAYWLGVLLADGSVDAKGRIKLGSIDKPIVDGFHRWVESNSVRQYQITTAGHPFWSTSIQCIEGRTLRENGVIPQNKTYNPPLFLSLTKWAGYQLPGFWLNVVVGLVDGDGYINEKYVTIRSHGKWRKFYEDLLSAAELKFFIGEYDDYLTISVGDKASRRKLYACSQQLPCVLKRKWSKISAIIEVESRHETVERLRPLAKAMSSSGVRLTDIAEQLDISMTRAYYLLHPDAYNSKKGKKK